MFLVKEKIVQLSKKFTLSFFIILICFILDRVSKVYVISLFTKTNFNDIIYVNSYLNFILLWNKGIAFGLLQSEQIFYHLITAIIFSVIFSGMSSSGKSILASIVPNILIIFSLIFSNFKKLFPFIIL